ncbi:MAG: peptidylprolyl isomerase [Flavobacteriia bacterium]|nr:peptidylprolyl isomerase [Flavobacteriia bacterium]
MATLEKIRRRSGLLIVVIGVALGAFLLTDFFTGGSSFLQGNPNEVGNVNGQTIYANEFNERIALLRTQNQQYSQMSEIQLSNIVWQQYLEENIYQEIYDELGFTVTDLENYNRILNNPNIRQTPAFIDQTTGQFSEAQFRNLLENLEMRKDETPENREQWDSWLEFEDDVRSQALVFKFNNAIQKGLYTPTAIARHEHAYNVISSDVGILQLPYSSVSDDEVEVTESDFEKYFAENKYKYKQDFETRDILYVNFAIEPSAMDKQEVRDELARLIEPEVIKTDVGVPVDTLPGFATTDNDSAFVVANSDSPYRGGYWRSGELSSNVDSILFQAEVGYVYGPYEESGGYKLTKLSDIATLPDSVSARHILISYATPQNQQVQRTRAEAQALADSLLDVLKSDRSQFDTLVVQYSNDPGSIENGGLYEWFQPKQMVAAFENFAYQNPVGSLGVVETQFGFHIMDVTEHSATKQKAIKIATVYREVITTNRTEKEVYNRAAEFAAAASYTDFATAADSLGLQVRPMTQLQATADQIIGLGQARDVVTWAFGKNKEVAEGDIELINNGNRSFVVAQLTNITEEGYRTLEDVREDIRPMVVNRVKAEQVLLPRAREIMTGETNIRAIAEKVDQNMALQQVKLANSAITGVGNEPEVVGAMSASQVTPVYGPMEGNQGVYIWQVNAISEFVEKGDYTTDQENATRQMRTKVSAQLFSALSKQVEIVDNRLRFF